MCCTADVFKLVTFIKPDHCQLFGYQLGYFQLQKVEDVPEYLFIYLLLTLIQHHNLELLTDRMHLLNKPTQGDAFFHSTATCGPTLTDGQLVKCCTWCNIWCMQ